MRRFIRGRKVLGYARCFGAEIVNYADDFCVLGKARAADMPAAVQRLREALKLSMNVQKTRCLRCPEEPFEFLGYRIGRNYRPFGKGAYIQTRPSSEASPTKSTGRRGRGYMMWCSSNDLTHKMHWLSAPTRAAIPGAVGAHGIVGAEPGVQDTGYARGPNVFVRISVSL